jgi:PAS domain S-box-containing protein
MHKKEYIEQETIKLFQYWGTIAIGAGALVILSLSGLDYFVTPENFSKFLAYRSISAFLFIILLVVNKRKASKYVQMCVAVLAAIIVATMVEFMVLSFGGHQSSYYVGMIIVFLFSLGFIPLFSLTLTIFFAVLIYFIYLFPILLFDKLTNVPVFINNNIFLLATASISIAWRYYNDKLFTNKLSLEYDLAQEKKQLEVYSSQLQSMVEERTKELHESEQWHRSLFENATEGIIVMDRHGIIINANDKAAEMHGFTREALVGTHIKLLSGDGDRDKRAERLNRILNGESLVFEATNNKKDGTSISFEISSKAISIGNELFIQSFYRDITEKQKFQQHLLQSQKMESVGVLAGGIAHDFNNILTAILGHTDLIRRFSVLDEKASRSLNVIEDASRRAGRMISKLLGFARKSKYERTPINLNDVVYETIKLLEQVIDKSINLSVELDNRLPLIQGDVNQMEQVIMNFIVNARDAMPKTGGRIVIRTQSRPVVKGMPDVPPYVPPGEYVQISVSDTGTGIPEEIVHKIFEPFFTTKEQGKGTGLGLSMVYGAIKDHEGYLSVQSTLGVGSVFTVYLPAASSTAVAESKAVSVKQTTGKETLLIVDDEQDILDVMRDSLESQGYKVFATSDSNVAMDLYRRIFHEVVLVISDIAMPGIDGKELIRQIKGVNPDVKILAVSGYSRYVAGNDEIKDIDGFLQKPFESYYLLSVVRRILDTKSKKSIPA